MTTTKTETTYFRAFALGKQFVWKCGRCLNNRGLMVVTQYGGTLWRADTKQKTTVAALKKDGWSRF
jgi:hypothetical protein